MQNWDFKELHELAERTARLPMRDQLYLIEMILAGIRKTHLTDYEAIKQEIAAQTERYSKQNRSSSLAEEAKCEAG